MEDVMNKSLKIRLGKNVQNGFWAQKFCPKMYQKGV